MSLLGEKLSKQQLQQSNIIKKLRVKEKESDTKITKQQKTIKEQEEELRHLQQVRTWSSVKPNISPCQMTAFSPFGIYCQ